MERTGKAGFIVPQNLLYRTIDKRGVGQINAMSVETLTTQYIVQFIYLTYTIKCYAITLYRYILCIPILYEHENHRTAYESREVRSDQKGDMKVPDCEVCIYFIVRKISNL